MIDVYICNISMNYSYKEKYFEEYFRKSCTESQNTYFMFKNIFRQVMLFMR